MPVTFATTLYTAQSERSYKLAQSPSHRPIQQNLKVARFTYTFVGTEAATDLINLGFLKTPNVYLIPELSRVTNISGGSGDLDCDFTLQSVNTAGTAVSQTAAASLDNNTVAFVRASTYAVVAETDYLRLLLSTADAVVAGEVLTIEIAYMAEAPF